MSALSNAGDFQRLGIYLICLVISVAVHEFGHAYAAHRLGDPTPEEEGRLTLNPLSHADPIGTFLLPVLAVMFRLPLFGWGKPVPTRPNRYTRNVTMRGGLALVALAGPMMNLVVAVVVIGIAALVNLAGLLSPNLSELLRFLVGLNLLLMVFNLLPVHPLDGGKILARLLPDRLQYIDDFMLRYGGFILLAVIFAGGGIISRLVVPFQTLASLAWKVVVGA